MRALACLAVLGCTTHPAAPGSPQPVSLQAAPPGQLLPAASFTAIADGSARSRALFGEIARVLTHPRCVNCHPADDTPRQGDAHAIHDPPALRVVPALKCTSCHQDRNVELARVPGAPNWSLAPASMAWLDRTPSQICAQIKDPARNGGRSLAKIRDHIAHDALVGWAWSPGSGRTPAPGSQAGLGELVTAWIDTGAECP